MYESRPQAVLPNWVATRIEACACGGFITAVSGNLRLAEEPVRRHQRTPRHLNWRTRWETAQA